MIHVGSKKKNKRAFQDRCGTCWIAWDRSSFLLFAVHLMWTADLLFPAENGCSSLTVCKGVPSTWEKPISMRLNEIVQILQSESCYLHSIERYLRKTVTFREKCGKFFWAAMMVAVQKPMLPKFSPYSMILTMWFSGSLRKYTRIRIIRNISRTAFLASDRKQLRKCRRLLNSNTTRTTPKIWSTRSLKVFVTMN